MRRKYISKPNSKCFICSKPIYRRPCRKSDHPFCSYACRNKYFSGTRSFLWKGGDSARIERKKSYQGRQRERDRRLARKAKAVEMAGGKCICCGYDRCVSALDFHHLDPEQKERDIKSLICHSWKIIETELAKCALLCSNCHREIHWRVNNGLGTGADVISELSEAIRKRKT